MPSIRKQCNVGYGCEEGSYHNESKLTNVRGAGGRCLQLPEILTFAYPAVSYLFDCTHSSILVTKTFFSFQSFS